MTVFNELIGLLAGLVMLAGCVSQGYVEVGTPVYVEPIYVSPPVYYWGPGPYYHYYHHPQYIAPRPPHRVVPAPRVTPTPPPRGNRPVMPPRSNGNGGPQHRQQGPPQRP